MKFALTLFLASASASASATSSADPHLWLEEIEGEKALQWVRAHNKKTESALTESPLFKPFEAQARKILLSDDRVPMPSVNGNEVFNFWQDKTHIRGIYRKTTVDSYRTKSPKWETIIDLDSLAKKENENWVWHGIDCFGKNMSPCIVKLSRGGTDADVVREFDLKTKDFVKDGFSLPEAKSNVSWFDKDTLLVGTEFFKGSLTKSGYPRIVKMWKRGTKLEEAKQLLEGVPDDVSVSTTTIEVKNTSYSFISRALDFYNAEYHFINKDGSLKKIPVPTHASFKNVFAGDTLFKLQKDWTREEITYKKGSLIALPIFALDSVPQLVYEPNDKESLESIATSENRLLLNTLNNVRGKIYSLQKEKSKYIKEELPLPQFGTVSIVTADTFSDKFYVRFEDYLTPQTLFEGTVVKNKTVLKKVKSISPKFSEEGLEVQQWTAKSKDGTMIPYFIVKKKDLELAGKAPTLLYGYGGFQVSLTPGYSAVTGKLWLEKGGVYVVANIRGGGEFGPSWHQAALKENRQRAYDDFQAVARDLIAKKVTSPQHLGIMGGSNGGLLMGVMYTQTPELFKAVVCQVPLLDMLRFHKLLAGHSWTGEYGNPDTKEEAEYISQYSPYQNVMKGKNYPHIFFVTSTKDDRVHPGHARKMAAKLEELGYKFDYFENIEGGHGAAANIEQRIYRSTLEYVYLTQMLTSGSDNSSSTK